MDILDYFEKLKKIPEEKKKIEAGRMLGYTLARLQKMQKMNHTEKKDEIDTLIDTIREFATIVYPDEKRV